MRDSYHTKEQNRLGNIPASAVLGSSLYIWFKTLNVKRGGNIGQIGYLHDIQ